MTASLRRACAAVGAPLGLVLEGGYSLEALTGSVAALMPVLVADSPPAVTTACRSTRWPRTPPRGWRGVVGRALACGRGPRRAARPRGAQRGTTRRA